MVSTPHVLVLSFAGDSHAEAIVDRLRRRFAAQATLWDTSGVPERHRVSISSPTGECVVDGIGDEPILLDGLASCWWRRPMAASIPEDVEDERVRHYCRRESDALIRGALLAAGVPLVNNPVRQSAADHKPLQLRIAGKVGLTIPETLITNDPAHAARFVDAHGNGSIFKAFNSPSWRIVETRKFEASMKEDLKLLRNSPIVLQELVPLGRDIRVAAMGGTLFAGEVIRNSPEAHLDWRLDPWVGWRPVSLPEALCELIGRLLDELGLHYGSLDFRQRPDGEFVFFEVNPSGQFLFLQQGDDTQIADAFCELLLSPA